MLALLKTFDRVQFRQCAGKWRIALAPPHVSAAYNQFNSFFYALATFNDRYFPMPILPIAWIIVSGLTYFAGARLGLSLLAQPEGVAVFWPASGLAAGAILPLNKPRRWMVASGIFIGTIAANLMTGRNPALSSAFGLCNVAEVLIFVAILQRSSPRQFSFENLRAGSWFIAAAAIAPAVSAAPLIAARATSLWHRPSIAGSRHRGCA